MPDVIRRHPSRPFYQQTYQPQLRDPVQRFTYIDGVKTSIDTQIDEKITINPRDSRGPQSLHIHRYLEAPKAKSAPHYLLGSHSSPTKRTTTSRDNRLPGVNMGFTNDPFIRGAPAIVHHSKDIVFSGVNPIIRRGKHFILPLYLSGLPLDSVPDSGSELNAISLIALKKLKLKAEAVWGSDDDQVQMANHSLDAALCQIRLNIQIPSPRSRPIDAQTWTFHVFAKLADGVKVIMGQKFLETYRIFTDMSHCLRERAAYTGQNTPLCMSIGLTKRASVRMRVYLDQNLVLALADTGSDINLVSRTCARRLRLQISPLLQEENSCVQFANGTLGRISGKVLVTFNAFEDPSKNLPAPTLEGRKAMAISNLVESGLPTNESTHDEVTVVKEGGPFDNRITLFVLDELPHDVTLSQELLYSMDAFNRHTSAFVTVDTAATAKEFYTIFWYKGKKCQTSLSGKDNPSIGYPPLSLSE
ncbi:hypothetical protein UCRPC4_g05535 [Phaeomoniella chlamydospora]|uniref:Uncharacterized protein n=1 Tax=Phaeomoniella chlamydospora TaxID=158046 RepID=A0A0G2E428_PHACM|nr:hypothetical protein UCRPC4_g05535 [Phaeomoniella chlamydospora]